jgi:hypothetical protein
MTNTEIVLDARARCFTAAHKALEACEHLQERKGRWNVKYEIIVHGWPDAPDRAFVGELHRDHTTVAACYGPTESDVRAKCLAVQELDEGGESPTVWESQERRDRFIAAAVTGWMACPDCRGAYAECAIEACRYADAVLAEADKKVGAT